MFGASIIQSPQVDARKEILTRTKYHRRKSQMHFIDQPGLEILTNSRHTATEAHILATGHVASALQSHMNAFGYEMESRAASHDDRRPCVVRKHKNGCVIRRTVAPPPLPGIIQPSSA